MQKKTNYSLLIIFPLLILFYLFLSISEIKKWKKLKEKIILINNFAINFLNKFAK